MHFIGVNLFLSVLAITPLVCGLTLERASAASAAELGAATPAAGPPAAEVLVPGGLVKPAQVGPYTVGQETTVRDPAVGPSGHYTVYVPPDYTPDRPWPIIFCYHGLGGPPTTQPYRQFVGGRGFLLVGMDYWCNTMDKSKGEEKRSKINPDVEVIKKIIRDVAQHLNIDPEAAFIAGNSAGGWVASGIAEATPSLWAGLIILGAGRYEDLCTRSATMPGVRVAPILPGFGVLMPKMPRDKTSLGGLAVYIGVGENDPNAGFARKAADFYRDRQAAVTFETYAGGAHGDYPATKLLTEWFQVNGPQRQVKAFVADAQAAEKAGKLGEAYTKYSQAASIAGVGPEDVAKAAAAIDREAQKQLQEAGTAYDAKRYTEAYTRYNNIAKTYDGSKYAEEARAILFRVKTAAGEEKERINTRAKALAEEALVAEKAKEYVKAVRLYEELLATCRGASVTDSVRNRLAALKENPAVQAALKEDQAARDCREWLAAADKFIEEGKTDKASELLHRILAKYANSEWAKQAQERLKALSPGSLPASKEGGTESGGKAGKPHEQVEPGK